MPLYAMSKMPFNLKKLEDNIKSVVYLRKGFYETKIHVYAMSSTYVAPNCPCPEKSCPRHGICEECVKHHKEKGEWPYCAR